MSVLIEFFSVVVGRWFLGGVGAFIRRTFQFNKKHNSSKVNPDPLDTQGAYDRFVGFVVVFLVLVLMKLIL